MGKILGRAANAAVLSRKAFNAAFFDGDAMADSAILVAAVQAVAYLGSLAVGDGLGGFALGVLFQVLIAGVVSWLVLGFGTWLAATRLFGATGQPQTMIALQGLAVLPLVLEMFGGLVALIGLAWYLIILVVATRHASDLPTREAGLSVLIGFALAALFRVLLGVPFVVFNSIF